MKKETATESTFLGNEEGMKSPTGKEGNMLLRSYELLCLA